MKLIKQTVYLLIKVKKELPLKLGYYHSSTKIHYFDKDNKVHKWYSDESKQYASFPKFWMKETEAFVFTSEQLNEYTVDVIKQTLETAAEKATYIKECGKANNEKCYAVFCHNCFDVIDKKSITNTFEETFEKFKV